MNRPLVHLLIALALLWRGLMPAGVMAMPGESGFEVRLCGLNGGTVVLDLGQGDPDPRSAMDHGAEHCPMCASLAGSALPSTVTTALPIFVAGSIPAHDPINAVPRGPPLQLVARGPPPLI